MFATPDSPLAPSVPFVRRSLAHDPHLLAPEAFRERVEAELVRHARYLSGAAVLRIGPRRGRLGAEALREAVETETRRSDAVCAYPDGSQAVLAVCADRRAVETLGRRLAAVAREIASDQDGGCPDFVVGFAATDGRRLGADELWMAANRELDDAADSTSDVPVESWS